MSNALKLFALTALEASADLPETATLREVWEEFNSRVTSAESMPFRQFQVRIREASNADLVHLADDADPRSGNGIKTDRGYFRGLRRSSAPNLIKKLRKELDTDVLKGVNQELFDAMLRNQIYLLRLSGSVRNQTWSLLDKSQKDIEAKLKARLAKHGEGGMTTQKVRDLQWMEKYIKATRLGTWDQVNKLWAEQMTELAKTEPKRMTQMVGVVSPTTIVFQLPDAAHLAKIASSTPFEGRILKEWAQDQAKSDLARLMNAVRVGMVQGEGIEQIVSRVQGVGDLTRRQSEAIIRTAVNFIGNEARAQFIEANKELWSGERFVATLDNRTTPVCRAHDGKVFDVGTGPRPPLHFRCRSLRVPTLNGEALGQRPAKASTERAMVKEFAAENDLDARSATRAALPKGFKGKFDAFARQRIRDLTTRVPSATSYQAWLETQSRAFQNDVLGATRAKLFRQGKLTLDRFVDATGRELTLAQLARAHAAAFRAAGLNPGDYA